MHGSSGTTPQVSHFTSKLQGLVMALEVFIKKVETDLPGTKIHFVLSRDATFNERSVIYLACARDPSYMIWYNPEQTGYHWHNKRFKAEIEKNEGGWNSQQNRIHAALRNAIAHERNLKLTEQKNQKPQTLCDDDSSDESEVEAEMSDDTE